MDPHASPFLLLFVYIPPLVASLMTPDDCCLLAGDVPHVSHSRFPSPAVTLTASLVDAQRRELQRLLRPHPPLTGCSLRPLHAVSRHVISSVISCARTVHASAANRCANSWNISASYSLPPRMLQCGCEWQGARAVALCLNASKGGVRFRV